MGRVPQKLNLSFYDRKNVVLVARELLGKILVTEWNGIRTSGRIVETEAYAGEMDRASHAFGGRTNPHDQNIYMAIPVLRMFISVMVCIICLM